MKNNFQFAKKIFIAITFFSICFLFLGCPISVNIKNLNEDNFKIEFSTTAGIELLKIINQFSDDSILQEAKIFNCEEIKDSLLELNLKNPKVSSIQNAEDEETLNVNFDFLKTDFEFIKILKVQNNKISKIEIILSPDILQNLIYNQNSIIQQYADLLMAPVFTNEKMSKEEYVDLISSVYGEKLATELIKGSLIFSINDASLKSEKFKIDLLEVLTLTTEKKFVLEAK